MHVPSMYVISGVILKRPCLGRQQSALGLTVQSAELQVAGSESHTYHSLTSFYSKLAIMRCRTETPACQFSLHGY